MSLKTCREVKQRRSQRKAAHIAALSRLKLSEEEAGRMAGELEQILSYMDVLDGLDTSGRSP